MALDWLARVHAPAWLDLTPALSHHAIACRALSPLTAATVGAANPVLDAAGAAARAAGWEAAGATARAAAWAAHVSVLMAGKRWRHWTLLVVASSPHTAAGRAVQIVQQHHLSKRTRVPELTVHLIRQNPGTST